MKTATEIRILYLKDRGLSEEEIQQDLLDFPPKSVEEEQAEFDAWEECKKIDLSWLPKYMEEKRKEFNIPEGKMFCFCTQCNMPVKSDEYGNWYCNHLDERPK